MLNEPTTTHCTEFVEAFLSMDWPRIIQVVGENKVFHDALGALNWSDAVLEQCDSEVQIQWPLGDKWAPQPAYDAPHGDNPFKRLATATIRALVNSPQFHRVTGTAHCLGQLQYSDIGKSMGIKATRKRAGKPFIIVFNTVAQATSFINLVQQYMPQGSTV